VRVCLLMMSRCVCGGACDGGVGMLAASTTRAPQGHPLGSRHKGATQTTAATTDSAKEFSLTPLVLPCHDGWQHECTNGEAKVLFHGKAGAEGTQESGKRSSPQSGQAARRHGRCSTLLWLASSPGCTVIQALSVRCGGGCVQGDVMPLAWSLLNLGCQAVRCFWRCQATQTRPLGR